MTKTNKSVNQILQTFKIALVSQNVGPGTVRSYLSDTRHFLTWLSQGLSKSSQSFQGLSLSIQGETLKGLEVLNRKTADRYYEHLVENQTPRQTLNRRLSSLRKFGAFCVSQGWLTDNYFAYLKNITLAQAVPQDEYHLNAYHQHLIADGNSPNTIKSYLSDVRHFINWVNVIARNKVTKQTLNEEIASPPVGGSQRHYSSQ